MFWGKLLAVLAAVFIIFILIRGIRANPQVFSKANFSKSFMTMGVLSLLLIAFIAICVYFLQSSA